MNTFTKTLIATALAVTVAGPAAANGGGIPFDDEFVSDKPLKVNISPANCKNTKFDFATSKLELSNQIFVDGEVDEDLLDFEGAGFWNLEGFTWTIATPDLFGIYTTKKIDKDLTASMYEGDLGGCAEVTIPEADACFGLAEAIQTAVIVEGCGFMTFAQSNTLEVTKSNIKLSKNGDRAKVDFKVEGEYVNTKGSSNKDKKVRLTIKGKNYDKTLGI